MCIRIFQPLLMTCEKLKLKYLENNRRAPVRQWAEATAVPWNLQWRLLHYRVLCFGGLKSIKPLGSTLLSFPLPRAFP